MRTAAALAVLANEDEATHELSVVQLSNEAGGQEGVPFVLHNLLYCSVAVLSLSLPFSLQH